MDKVQKTLEEAKSIVAFVSNLTKEVVKDIRASGKFPKPFEFVVASDTQRCFEVYIKGNKVNGEDYELNTWKSVPIVKAEIHENYDTHPSAPNQSWVAFGSLAGGWGCDNPENLRYTEDGYFRKHIERAIKESIEDFTEQQTL